MPIACHVAVAFTRTKALASSRKSAAVLGSQARSASSSSRSADSESYRMARSSPGVILLWTDASQESSWISGVVFAGQAARLRRRPA